MNKVFTSAVVIIPPVEIWTPIQQIRKQYDRHVNRWMPHINLLYPFKPERYFDELSLKFEKTISDILSFQITFREIKYFTHGKQRYTIWLAPEPKSSINNLQRRIFDIVPDCDDLNKFRNGYTPHLSLGQIYGHLNKSLNQLRGNWGPISFTLKKIAFISREGGKNSKFQVKREIYLKSSLE